MKVTGTFCPEETEPSSLYDLLLIAMQKKDYLLANGYAIKLWQETVVNKRPWAVRKPIIDTSKSPEINQTLDSPAGPLWGYIKGINQVIREMPPEELNPPADKLKNFVDPI